MKNPKSTKKLVVVMITKKGITKTWIDPRWQEKQAKRGSDEGV